MASRDSYAKATAGVLRDTGNGQEITSQTQGRPWTGRPQLTLYSVAVCCSQMVSSSMSAT